MNVDKNRGRSTFLSWLRIIGILFAILVIFGFLNLFLECSVKNHVFAKSYIKEFEKASIKILQNEALLETADLSAPSDSIDLPSILGRDYKSVGLFEWRGHWEPIILTSPVLADISLNPGDFKHDFYRSYNTLFWKNNQNTALSKTPFLYSAAWRQGRLFLLGVELEHDLLHARFLDFRRAALDSIFYIIPVSLFFAVICAILLNLMAQLYSNRILGKIREGRVDMPNPLFPGLDRMAYHTAENAHEADRQRHQKRTAIMEKRNEFENERRDFALVRSITESTALAPDLKSAAATALEPIVRRFGVRCGGIYSFDSTGLLYLVGEYNLPADIAYVLGKDENATPIIVRSSKQPSSFAILPIQSIPGFDESPLKSLREEGVTHCILIPLKYRDRLWGIMHLYCAGRQRIKDKERTIAIAVANGVTAILENKRLLGDLDIRMKENINYYELSKMLISTSDFDILLENILWIVRESIGADHCSIMLVDGEGESLSVKASWGYPKEHQNPRLKFGEGIVGWVAENGQAVVVHDVNSDERYLLNIDSVKSELVVPLISHGSIIGVIDCESDTEYSFDESDIRLLTHLAEPVSLAIERTIVQADLAKNSILDPVTQLYNRSYFDDYISKYGEELLLHHKRVSVAVIGITNFHEVLKSYGRDAANIISNQTADILRELFPESIKSRYSDSEFFVLLPGIGEEAMERLLDKLREYRIRWSREHADALPLSFTAGYETANRFDELRSLISRADGQISNDRKKKNRDETEDE